MALEISPSAFAISDFVATGTGLFSVVPVTLQKVSVLLSKTALITNPHVGTLISATSKLDQAGFVKKLVPFGLFSSALTGLNAIGRLVTHKSDNPYSDLLLVISGGLTVGGFLLELHPETRTIGLCLNGNLAFSVGALCHGLSLVADLGGLALTGHQAYMGQASTWNFLIQMGIALLIGLPMGTHGPKDGGGGGGGGRKDWWEAARLQPVRQHAGRQDGRR